jgi:hypothetical protein
LSASLARWLRNVSQREREASMSFVDVHSAAIAGTADALIAAEATRTSILLIIELHRASWYEENYCRASASSIARESFLVRLWLRQINFGLERTTVTTSDEAGPLPTS